MGMTPTSASTTQFSRSSGRHRLEDVQPAAVPGVRGLLHEPVLAAAVAHEHRVDPLEARLQDRLGDLLEPAMQREAAVVQGDRVVGTEAQCGTNEVSGWCRCRPARRRVVQDNGPTRVIALRQNFLQRLVDRHEGSRLADPALLQPRGRTSVPSAAVSPSNRLPGRSRGSRRRRARRCVGPPRALPAGRSDRGRGRRRRWARPRHTRWPRRGSSGASATASRWSACRAVGRDGSAAGTPR